MRLEFEFRQWIDNLIFVLIFREYQSIPTRDCHFGYGYNVGGKLMLLLIVANFVKIKAFFQELAHGNHCQEKTATKLTSLWQQSFYQNEIPSIIICNKPNITIINNCIHYEDSQWYMKNKKSNLNQLLTNHINTVNSPNNNNVINNYYTIFTYNLN